MTRVAVEVYRRAGAGVRALTTARPVQVRAARWGVVALMFACSVMSYFDRTIMSIAGPTIIREFRLTETEMGSVYSAFLLTYALLMIPGGRLADRFGPRLVLTGMGLGAAVFTGLTALGGAPGLGAWLGVVPSFVVIRLGLGAVTAPIYPSCATVNANWVPVMHRARVQGFIAAGAGLGGAVSPLLFSYLIATYGWRASFCFAAAATAALAVVWFWYVRDHPSGSAAQSSRRRIERRGTPWRALLTNRDLMILTASYVTLNYFTYVFFFWMYYYLVEIRKMGTEQSGFYAAIMFLSWMVMAPLGGWASDHAVRRFGQVRGARIVPMVVLVTAVVLLVLAVNATTTAAVVALLSLSLGFAAASDGPYWAAAIGLGRGETGAASGILNSGGNLGGFFAPILTAYIASQTNWTWSLYFSCAFMMVGVALWPFVRTASPTAPGEDSGSGAEQAAGAA